MPIARRLRRLIAALREGDPDGPYQCRDCETRYGRRRQVCPQCDGYRVERREW